MTRCRGLPHQEPEGEAAHRPCDYAEWLRSLWWCLMVQNGVHKEIYECDDICRSLLSTIRMLGVSDLRSEVAFLEPKIMSIASILKDVYPENSDFTCRQWLPDKGRRCLLHIEKTVDRPKAARLAAKMRQSNPWELNVNDLEELAEVCYCKRWHRWKDPDNLNRTATHWLEELRQEYDRTHPPQPQPQPRTSLLRIAHGRGHRPVTRSMTSRPHDPFTQNRSNEEFDDGVLQFSPHKPQISTWPKVHELVAQKIDQRLGVADRDHGFIYIFSRSESPGYLKIGFTDNCERRMKEWQRQCGYQPILLYKSPFIPNARRVEQFVFLELALARRRERCMNGKGCGREHREWFEVELTKARALVKYWIEWMKAEPYDEDGNLYNSWTKALEFVDLKTKSPWKNWIKAYIPKVHWFEVWEAYLASWVHLKVHIETGVCERKDDGHCSLRDVIRWPVQSGLKKDISAENVKIFLQNASFGLDPATTFDWQPSLKAERIRWHPDKIQQRYGKLGIDEPTLKAITAVSQVMNKLWEEQKVRNP